MLRPPRFLIRGLIILFWAVATGTLVYQEAVLPYVRTAPMVLAAETPRDYWMSVLMGDSTRVGFIHVRSKPDMVERVPGSRINLTVRLALSLFGQDTSLLLNGEAWRSSDSKAAEVDFDIASGEHEMKIEGKLADGTLDARLHTAGEVTPLTFPVDSQLLFGGGLGAGAVDLPILEPGQEVYIDSFDPTTMSIGKAKIVCERIETVAAAGEPVQARVYAISIGGITTRAWVTEEQETVRAETPFGLTLIKTTAQEAMRPLEGEERASLVQSLSVQPTGLAAAVDLKRMRFRISGLPEELTLPEDGYQRLIEPGVYEVAPPESPLALTPAELGAEEREALLAADPLVTSDHPLVVEAAAEATRGAETDLARAMGIYDWVFANIDKVPIISVPSALDVLRTKQGDCNEHTVLFTAMSRAVGVPCRIVIGLVYSDSIGGFGYHAWPEVYVEGGWLPMDPTLGQPVADATHVKLLTGSIDKWTALVNYIGRIEMEILETEPVQEGDV